MKVASGRGRVFVALVCAAFAGGISLASSPVFADTAVAFGLNEVGELGNGTTANSSTLVYVNGLGNNVTAIASGPDHSLAIQNGVAYAWGINGNGELGNGTYGSAAQSNVPVAVNTLTTGVTAISGGGAYSLAIQNGAAYAWGDDAAGQLGNGTSGSGVFSATPVPVTGLSSGVTAVAAGSDHSLAIKAGAAYAWGDNFNGQLGNGTNSSSSIPVPVTGLTSGVTAIAAGSLNSLAIQSGAAYAWGDNTNGQLGNGAFDFGFPIHSTPVPVSGLSSGVTAIAIGGTQCLAIKDGNVYAWGSTYPGNGNTQETRFTTPFKVLDLPVDLIAIAGSPLDSNYALSADGSLWVWGYSLFGQLGLGDTSKCLTPTQLFAPAGYKFTAIDADGEHVVAMIVPVPEPASLSVLMLGGVWCCRRRK